MCIENHASWNSSGVCTEGSNLTGYDYKKSKTSTTYSIKKVLKAFFKKNQLKRKEHQLMASETTTTTTTTMTLSTSLESFDNIRNTQVEDHYEEIEENTANEKLLSCIYDEYVDQQNISNHYQQNQHVNFDENAEDNDDVFVPVRYARTEAGTFFWTTSIRVVDTDLIQPVYCSTSNQFPVMQFQLQDRWAQA